MYKLTRQMLDIIQDNRLCKSHAADLGYDINWIAENPSVPFVWRPYEQGTHLFTSKPRYEHEQSLFLQVDQDFSRGLWFYFDGQTLAQCATWKEAFEVFFNVRTNELDTISMVK